MTAAPDRPLTQAEREQRATETLHRTGNLRSALHGLRLDWPDVLDAPSGPGAAGSAVPGPRLPISAGRLHLAAEVPRALAAWRRLVIRERGLRGHLTGATVPHLVHWLDPHLPWLAAHPRGPEMATEVQHLADRVHAVVDPDGIKRVPVCPCPVATPDGTCPGLVTATLVPDGPDPEAVCDVDATHAWGVSAWPTLARLARHGADEPAEWMTAPALAAWLSTHLRASVSTPSISVWSHRYPGFPPPDAATGLWPRHAITAWYVDHRAGRHHG